MGDGVVGFGLSAGLAERLEAYRKESGVKLPLKFMIAADHHDEDIGGAADATAAGATLVVTEHTVLKLRGREVDHALDVVTDEKTIEGFDHFAPGNRSCSHDLSRLSQSTHKSSFKPVTTTVPSLTVRAMPGAPR